VPPNFDFAVVAAEMALLLTLFLAIWAHGTSAGPSPDPQITAPAVLEERDQTPLIGYQSVGNACELPA
jgi:hypothetical protein